MRSPAPLCSIAVVAEEEGHHPDLHLTGYNTVVAEMTTHAAKGLTENDFIMAAKVGRCGGSAWGAAAGAAPGMPTSLAKPACVERVPCSALVTTVVLTVLQNWQAGRASVGGSSALPRGFSGTSAPILLFADRAPQINELEISDLLPKRKPKFWA